MDAVTKYRLRRAERIEIEKETDSVEEYRRRRAGRLAARFDDDEDEIGGSHGNTKIPFGLCEREGIEIQKGWTPKDAWEALEGKGYNAGETYQELKKNGNVEKRQAPKKSLRDMKREYDEYETQNYKANERYYKASDEFKKAKRMYELTQDPELVKKHRVTEENIKRFAEEYRKTKKELEEAEKEKNESEKRKREIAVEIREAEKYPKNFVRTPEVKEEVKRVEDVFRKQPVEYASCVDSSGKNVFKTTDKSDSTVNLALYADYMKNGVLTHNHPGGGTFSIEDISTAVSTGLAEMRACTEKGAFSLVRQYSLDEGPTESQKEFAWRYKLAMDDYAKRVTDPIWQNSAQLQEDADRCNRMAQEFGRNWLKKNAHKFGWEYTEENING